jgi:carbon-monoxide dehydrogenase small subunit
MSDEVRIRTTVNGVEHEMRFPPERTTLELLRDDLDLLGTREGCGVGVCGSCTVLVDERPVSSCLLLATNLEGKEVVTIEGLGDGTELDPVQDAFLEESAFQCGYCTPGMILAVKGLLASHERPTLEEAREYLAGNLCRCGTYVEVMRAVAALLEQHVERSDRGR